jgi:tRNA-specific 2-thiouridylase
MSMSERQRANQQRRHRRREAAVAPGTTDPPTSGLTRERVLVAMSGGVDSSVAAALLLEAGHDVVGATLKLWGGASDSGCCSVADVDDARSVARRLGIEHHTFSFGDDFDEHVVAPYLADHAAGRTPNPCIECNRHLKFDRLLRRADALGFEAVATGHHARIVERADGSRRVARGADAAKDQSYVVHMVDQATLARIRFPVGHLAKADVRAEAARLGLTTADKPDSQDVCFITATGGREAFLEPRLATHPGTVVDRTGERVGHVRSVELVTIGQRHGLGLPGGTEPRYVVAVDVPSATVTVGDRADLLTDRVELDDLRWVAAPTTGPLLAQTSAHGSPRPCRVEGAVVHFDDPTRRVAPGQSVVLYAGDEVVAGGIVR